MFDKYIQFKREREIGEILSDTFKFIRENMKPLFSVLLKTVGIPFIVLIFAITYYTFTTSKQSLDLFSVLNSPNGMSNGLFDFYSSIFLGAIIMLIASAIFYAFLVSSVHYAVKSYIKNEGTIIQEEVSVDVKQNWLNYLGMSFLIGILTVIGFMLCFLPGIYIGVVLTLMYSIYAFNNLSVGESFSYCFQLIKSNWWMSFFAMLITYILVYILSLIFQLPAIIYMFLGITINNIRVGLMAYVLGIFLGLGTLYVLMQNAIMLGSFQYFFYDKGLLWESVRTIWIHGTIEISVIIVAGCAGLVVGKGLLFPGTYTRLQSFINGIKAGLKVIISTVPFFIIAGFLEGFVTRQTQMPDWLAISIILISLALMVYYYIIYPIQLHKKEITHV